MICTGNRLLTRAETKDTDFDTILSDLADKVMPMHVIACIRLAGCAWMKSHEMIYHHVAAVLPSSKSPTTRRQLWVGQPLQWERFLSQNGFCTSPFWMW
jgi:hypothetical protein